MQNDDPDIDRTTRTDLGRFFERAVDAVLAFLFGWIFADLSHLS